MDKFIYIMLMENARPLNADIVARHALHLKGLDSLGALVLCGPFSDYAGGLVALRARSFAEADALCRADPFIAEGFKTYSLRTLEIADSKNGYLLG